VERQFFDLGNVAGHRFSAPNPPLAVFGHSPPHIINFTFESAIGVLTPILRPKRAPLARLLADYLRNPFGAPGAKPQSITLNNGDAIAFLPYFIVNLIFLFIWPKSTALPNHFSQKSGRSNSWSPAGTIIRFGNTVFKLSKGTERFKLRPSHMQNTIFNCVEY